MIEERSNLKKAEAINDWNYYGRPALLALFDHTGLKARADTGAWKVFVRDCHYRPQAKKGAPPRVSGVHENTRRIEVTLQPLGSKYTFEVDLATDLAEPPFPAIVGLFRSACIPLAISSARPAKPETTESSQQPAPTPREQILGGLDLAKLLKMRDGFDQLISVGKDVQTAAELKREIEAKVASAEAVAAPLRYRHESATTAANESILTVATAQEKVDELNKKLADAVTERDRLMRERGAAIECLEAVTKQYEPAFLALEAARKELESAEQLEAERLKTLGKADDLLPLLAALQKLG